MSLCSHHAARRFDKGVWDDYNKPGFDGLARKKVSPGEIDAERGLPRGASVYIMGSSNIVEVAGLRAGGRQSLFIEERVSLEPFEGKTFALPARVQLKIQRVDGAVRITGSIQLQAFGECDRCLVEVRFPMLLEVDELLERPQTLTTDPFAENSVLAGDRLDIADLTQQLVCSAVPFALRCNEDCKGLCSVCGADLNSQSCGCSGETIHGQP